MRVDTFLDRTAARLADRCALVSGAERLSYGTLAEAVDRFAGALAEAGVRRGDRVVVHLDNSPEAVIAIFGALKAGAAFVPVNPSAKAGKLGFVLRDCGATAVVGHARRASLIRAAIEHCPAPPAVVLAGQPDSTDTAVSLERVVRDGSLRSPASSGIDMDLAALIYTSGSTGNPKGVMLTHANMACAATAITGYLENTSDDVILNVLPLSFDYGLYQVVMSAMVGARLVLERSFTYPTSILQLLVEECVTGFPIVPTIAALLLRHDLRAYDFSHLRYITNTGAVLPPAHIAAIRTALPKVKLFSMYGLTECKRVSFLDPNEIDMRPTSVGKPMDNVEVWLVDDSGRRIDSGVGELVIRGSNVMQGYWQQPEETARALRPGPYQGEVVLHSGDLFRMDEQGYLYFVSRRDDIIKTRGEKVSPKEVENAIYELEGVREVAVVGVPDPVLGQALKAYVVVDEGVHLAPHDVVRHCTLCLEDFMVPRIVEFSLPLPRTSSGKIDRKGLGQLA